MRQHIQWRGLLPARTKLAKLYGATGSGQLPGGMSFTQLLGSDLEEEAAAVPPAARPPAKAPAQASQSASAPVVDSRKRSWRRMIAPADVSVAALHPNGVSPDCRANARLARGCKVKTCQLVCRA